MRKIGVFTIFLLLVSLGQSCIEEQDFTQYHDVDVLPQFESSIIYIEATENIINQASSSVFYTQVFEFNPFSENAFADRVVDGVITYELENTTSKDLEIELEFLDEGGNILYTESFEIEGEPTAVLSRDVFFGNTGESLDILINTASIRVIASNPSGDFTSTSTEVSPLITLKSSGKFTINIK